MKLCDKFKLSSNEIAVYIAKKTNRRSVYLEIVECKRNILRLKKAISKLSVDNNDMIMYDQFKTIT